MMPIVPGRRVPPGRDGPRQTWRAVLARSAPLVVLPAIVLFLGFGLLAIVAAWQERQLFMSGCTMGHLDDERLRLCNLAFDRYRADAANGWRPLGGGE